MWGRERSAGPDDVQVCSLGTAMRKPQGETGLAKMI